MLLLQNMIRICEVMHVLSSSTEIFHMLEYTFQNMLHMENFKKKDFYAILLHFHFGLSAWILGRQMPWSICFESSYTLRQLCWYHMWLKHSEIRHLSERIRSFPLAFFSRSILVMLAFKVEWNTLLFLCVGNMLLLLGSHSPFSRNILETSRPRQSLLSGMWTHWSNSGVFFDLFIFIWKQEFLCNIQESNKNTVHTLFIQLPHMLDSRHFWSGNFQT